MITELLEDEAGLVQLRLGLVEIAEMRQHIALVGQHPGPAQRIRFAIASLQYGLVEFDRFDKVVQLVTRRGVHQRVGQIQLHAGPLLRVVLGGVDLQRRAQRLPGHAEAQLTGGLGHRHRQIGGGQIGMRRGPQQRRLLAHNQLQRRVVVRHRASQHVRPIPGLLMQQSGQGQVQLRAGNPQPLGAVERLQCPFETAHGIGALDDRGRRPQQHPAQRLGYRRGFLGRAVEVGDRAGRVAVVQRGARLSAQHERRQLPGEITHLRCGVAAADRVEHHIDQNTEFSEGGTQFGWIFPDRINTIRVHHEAVVPADRIRTGELRQGAVPVTLQCELMGPQCRRPHRKLSGQ